MGVGADLYMCDVVKKVHVRYLISWWVLVIFWSPIISLGLSMHLKLGVRRVLAHKW